MAVPKLTFDDWNIWLGLSTAIPEATAKSPNKPLHPSRRRVRFAMDRSFRRLGERWRSALKMAIPKFKIRLGSQQHLTLSGKRYVNHYRPDTYNCRLSLRCGPLQSSGVGDFDAAELRSFVNSMLEIIKCLR